MSLLAETPPHTAPTLVWRNRFATLGEAFFTDNPPTPLPDPRWVAWSPSVAADLGLPTGWMNSTEAAEVFTGNRLLPGSRPLASVYSGHQFGVWAGQLGDGRALLLGEWDTPLGAAGACGGDALMRVAAVQATSVVLDVDASTAKAIDQWVIRTIGSQRRRAGVVVSVMAHPLRRVPATALDIGGKASR